MVLVIPVKLTNIEKTLILIFEQVAAFCKTDFVQFCMHIYCRFYRIYVESKSKEPVVEEHS